MSKLLFLILVVFNVSFICSNVVDLSNEKHPVIDLNFESQNSIYKIKKNSVISVLISGNETTGYRWYANNDNKNDKIKFLNLDESNSTSDYEVSQRNGKYIAGAGGQYNFKVEVNSVGDLSITFEYKRSWEPEPISFINLKLQIN